MKSTMTAADMQELERQLGHPEGKRGVEVGLIMNESNLGMIKDTINCLNPEQGNHILELGPGNGAHLPIIMEQSTDLRYTGLEISQTMYDEAISKNAQLVDEGNAAFKLYDGAHLPFPGQTFDRIMTVNTLYFWQDPVFTLNELARVIRPGGHCLITYAQKESMLKLPFVGSRFRLYDDQDFTGVASLSLLAIDEIIPRKETVRSKAGDIIERKYAIARLIRK